ncbi:MAG: porin [Verrucomicrobiota bacterium]|nr:porin [Verrucomicrobiota bacterium]
MKRIVLLFSAAIMISVASAAEPTASPSPESRVKITGFFDTGITVNPSAPQDNQNFGRLFDDRSNEFVMNQAVITAERALNPKVGLDWGFKLQLLFGTDARYIHSLGLLDHARRGSLYHPDIPEAYLSLYFPIFTEGGVDLKLGKFVTLEGAETIDPRTNPFYSHTYIFNFAIPFNHTGALFTLYATKWLNLVAGVTRGVNTSIDDNNDAPAFHGGIGLHLNEEKFVVSAATHIGPETPHNEDDLRYLNTITTTWKVTDKITSITDLNYTYDEPADAKAYGVAQYLIYTINDKVTAKIRGEIWRDAKGFYAAQFADPHDPIRGLAGESTIDPRTVGGGRTTYGALTIGLDIKPPVPKPLAGLTIRPELRFDRALNGTHPFNDSNDRDQFTAALDVIVTF